MGHWLAPPGAAKAFGHLKRFDPRYWSVNFPRPMTASVVTTGAHSLKAECVFYRQDDLAGLIWEAEDRFDHVLLRYEMARDFRACRLSFRWRSAGLRPLDAIDGPTLTIEGRDQAGQPRSWFVRLWNYASGTPEDAMVDLDFASIDGGFLLPDEADPVWAGDVDRMFISLVPPGFTRADALLAAPEEGWVELSGIACEGAGSVLAIGDTRVPEHRLRIATGYDDLYHVTPARMLRNVMQLGYRGPINHYVGMSHYFRLGSDLKVMGGLNGPCAAWHRDFAARAKTLGHELILSLSYELLDQHCPEAWKQRFADGTPALTGWVPPSALLSPVNEAAMGYLQGIAREFAAVVRDAGLAMRFQVGEPWWWVAADGRIALYDDAAVAAFAPVPIADARAALDEAQKATLDAAGVVLAGSTAALCAAVKAEAAGAETLLLVYLPTVLEGAEVRRANVPLGWAAPAFDVLQLEDYDWVTGGRGGATGQAVGEMAARLGYPLRGRMGTEWAAVGHVAGEPFLLVESDALALIEPPPGRLGGEVRLLAIGRDDGDGIAASLTLLGEALHPPAPVHLTSERQVNGDIALGWVRRSRRGWTWLSGSDTPLAEEREAYRVEIAGTGFVRAVEVGSSQHLYTAAEQAADEVSGPLEVRVMQLGTHGASRPIVMTIEI